MRQSVMSTLGKSIAVKGELRASEDLTVEGRIEGPITCENSAVVIAGGASVSGQVIARNITVFGAADGQLIASGVVDVRADAAVTGQVIARSFVLDGNAYFKGRVSPERVDAAIGVARYNQRQRDQDEADSAPAPAATV
jgi:cytoskeletal protein CcmA (bactofilin family)